MTDDALGAPAQEPRLEQIREARAKIGGLVTVLDVCEHGSEQANAVDVVWAAVPWMLNQIEQLEADLAANDERLWVRRKFKIADDAPVGNVYGKMHNLEAHAHGYIAYIEAFKCDDKQGEIARLTVRAEQAESELAALRASQPQDDLQADLEDFLVQITQDAGNSTWRKRRATELFDALRASRRPQEPDAEEQKR